MYKYLLNFVVKIAMMFAKYFEYYTIILRGGGVFSWTRCISEYFDVRTNYSPIVTMSCIVLNILPLVYENKKVT